MSRENVSVQTSRTYKYTESEDGKSLSFYFADREQSSILAYCKQQNMPVEKDEETGAIKITTLYKNAVLDILGQSSYKNSKFYYLKRNRGGFVLEIYGCELDAIRECFADTKIVRRSKRKVRLNIPSEGLDEDIIEATLLSVGYKRGVKKHRVKSSGDVVIGSHKSGGIEVTIGSFSLKEARAKVEEGAQSFADFSGFIPVYNMGDVGQEESKEQAGQKDCQVKISDNGRVSLLGFYGEEFNNIKNFVEKSQRSGNCVIEDTSLGCLVYVLTSADKKSYDGLKSEVQNMLSRCAPSVEYNIIKDDWRSRILVAEQERDSELSGSGYGYGPGAL